MNAKKDEQFRFYADDLVKLSKATHKKHLELCQ